MKRATKRDLAIAFVKKCKIETNREDIREFHKPYFTKNELANFVCNEMSKTMIRKAINKKAHISEYVYKYENDYSNKRYYEVFVEFVEDKEIYYFTLSTDYDLDYALKNSIF